MSARERLVHLGSGLIRHPRWRGQSMVEFALCLPLFIALFFGIFEIGRLMQAHATVRHAVEEAARYATSGDRFTEAAGIRESAIVAVARASATGLQISDGAGADEPVHFRVVVRSSKSGPNPMESNNAGGANDFVRIDVDYNYPVIVRVFGETTYYVPVHASTMVMNERFARPTGIVGQLPPTPVATWTNTPTPSPTPTPNFTATAVAATLTAAAHATGTAAAAPTATAAAAATATASMWTATPLNTPASTYAAQTATKVAQTATKAAQNTATAAAKTATAAGRCVSARPVWPRAGAWRRVGRSAGQRKPWVNGRGVRSRNLRRPGPRHQGGGLQRPLRDCL